MNKLEAAAAEAGRDERRLSLLRYRVRLSTIQLIMCSAEYCVTYIRLTKVEP